MNTLPTFDDVLAAAKRIEGYAHKTPVMQSSILNQALGAEVFFKCENLQRMGAFKFRGAFNSLALLDEAQREKGVITYSSGNHAQGIALAASLLGIPATIVMPKDAPKAKRAATEGYGAKVVEYDRYTQDRESITHALAQEHGYAVVPAYDYAPVIAGQGTAVKELLEEVGELDALFVPLGGGGLLAGSALAARALSPDCKIYGVEPEAGNDGQQSFRSGGIVKISTPKTIADGAQTPSLGQINFSIIQRDVDDIYTSTDAQLVDSMAFFASRMKLIVEPTGCLGLAALRANAENLRGKRIGVVISGGNVDLDNFAHLLAEHANTQETAR
jgi:threonine dehydratase